MTMSTQAREETAVAEPRVRVGTKREANPQAHDGCDED
jgi:hypothetical protein